MKNKVMLCVVWLFLLTNVAAQEFPKSSHWSYLREEWHPVAQLEMIDRGHSIEPWLGLGGMSEDNWEVYSAGLEELNRRGILPRPEAFRRYALGQLEE